MKLPVWITPLFMNIDRQDARSFATFLAPDVTFRWGSRNPVTGRDAVEAHVAGLFSLFKGLEHKLIETWFDERTQTVFVQGEVTYRLADERTITLPFLNLLRLQDGLIAEYLIYADPSPLQG